jgi:hypothetical protein
MDGVKSLDVQHQRPVGVMGAELVNTNVEGGSGARWLALLEAVLYE